MIRSSHVGIALAFAAVLSVPPSMGAFAQSNGCKQTGQAEGNRHNTAQAEGTRQNTAQAEGNRQNTAQAEGNRQNLAQTENSSSGGGMYGRQYSQAEGNRQNNAPRLASGTVPGAAPCR